MIISKNVWLEKGGMRDFVSTANEIKDSKFAVVNGIHLSLVCFCDIDNKEINESIPCVDRFVIEMFDAEECYNLSSAHKDFYSDENLVCVYIFDDEQSAIMEFEHLIHHQLTK